MIYKLMDITIDPTVGEQKSHPPQRLLHSPKNKGQKGYEATWTKDIKLHVQCIRLYKECIRRSRKSLQNVDSVFSPIALPKKCNV